VRGLLISAVERPGENIVDEGKWMLTTSDLSDAKMSFIHRVSAWVGKLSDAFPTYGLCRSEPLSRVIQGLYIH
jgi:hypothetical protein